MASLQNEQIDQSYQGLIKTANNLGGGPFPPAKLQYGDGQELPISIGDGTGVGIGDIVTLTSGTRAIDLNSANLALTGLTYVDALAGTTNISNGTYEFGLSFPGAPATNVDFTNATVTGLPAAPSAPMVSLPRTTGNSSSGCDVIYSSVLIPANTFGAGDILQLSGAMSASSSANTIWSAYWISTNGTVGGGATEEVNMGQLALSDADWAVGFQKNLYINVADGTGAGTELVTGMAYSDVDGNVNTSGIQSYSPDWTSDLYFVNRSCIQATNTGVTYVDHGAVLKKIN
jgi:hypothetical protein